MGIVLPAAATEQAPMFIHYLAVGLLGASVGIAELVARYRDNPAKALRAFAAVLYVGLNAAAGVGAFALARVFGWKFGITAGGDALLWTQVLVSGFGAMAVFRSSLFLVRVGNQDLGVGPSGFLQIMLKATDAGVDRNRATGRARFIATAMKGVSFERAHRVLPSLCLALMQNLSKEDQDTVAAQIAAIAPGAEATDESKALVLGLLLLNLVGEDVLKEAVKTLGDQIRAP